MNHDPHHLLDEYLPSEAPIESRVVVAAALRNPDWDRYEVAEFVDVSSTTVKNALAAYYRGNLDKRGDGEQGGANKPHDERDSLDDFTSRQQAVIELFARWPDLREEHDWTWDEVAGYIAQKTGIDMTPNTVSVYKEKCEDFTEDFRARLRDRGVLDEIDDVPTKPSEMPTDTRGLVIGGLEHDGAGEDALPDENLDAGLPTYGEDDWVEPYATVDLNDVEPETLPHAGESGTPSDSGSPLRAPFDPNLHSQDVIQVRLDGIASVEELQQLRRAEAGGPNREPVLDLIDDRIEAVESGEVETDPESEDTDPEDVEATVEVEAGNASYSGPSSGVVVGSGQPTQSITDAPAYQEPVDDSTDEDASSESPDAGSSPPTGGEEPADVNAQHDEEQLRDEPATDEEVLDSLIESMSEQPDEPDEDDDAPYDVLTEPWNSPFSDLAFEAIVNRLEGLIEQAEREHELHPSEASAARLAAYERSMKLVRGFRPDEDEVTIHD